jgi:predicted nucleic acid-binding protein
MSTIIQKYCLDANVLIQAWQKYYSPKFCPEYWNILNDFGNTGKIFLPQHVYDEIVRTEDDLANWLKSSRIPVFEVDGRVAECLRGIYAANPVHQYLVDNTKQRSLADPWVIAHAIKENACVVTKEEKVTTPNTTRIKIPNVCDNMNIRWVNDFQFIEELNIQFSCTVLDN